MVVDPFAFPKNDIGLSFLLFQNPFLAPRPAQNKVREVLGIHSGTQLVIQMPGWHPGYTHRFWGGTSDSGFGVTDLGQIA